MQLSTRIPINLHNNNNNDDEHRAVDRAWAPFITLRAHTHTHAPKKKRRRHKQIVDGNRMVSHQKRMAAIAMAYFYPCAQLDNIAVARFLDSINSKQTILNVIENECAIDIEAHRHTVTFLLRSLTRSHTHSFAQRTMNGLQLK